MRTLLSRLFARLRKPTDLEDEYEHETEAEHAALVAMSLARLRQQLPPGSITL